MTVLRLRESSNTPVSHDKVVEAIMKYGSESSKRDIMAKIEKAQR